MHAATLSRSARLQAVLAFLSDRGERGATTRELQDATGSCAVHSDIAELRANGVTVTRTYEGKTLFGRQVNRYRLVAQPEAAR